MENNNILLLSEWAPLSDLLEKIPSKIQRGLFYIDVNITCLDVLPEFIAIGTDIGISFWYNRLTGDVQKLRSEISSGITCIKIVSSVEYLIAAGSACGQVSIFQIQKEHPPDLDLVTPLTKIKPIQRYTIRDLHHSPVKCVEWSKNGMKLFSGDKQGIVVLTEFDFQTHISKSREILNEAYEIVQISFTKPWLLISTVYRAIICQPENDTDSGKWQVLQIGKKDRKMLSDFGAIFYFGGNNRNNNSSDSNDNNNNNNNNINNNSNINNNNNTYPSVICSRPGFRIWLADLQGNVAQTFLFKDTIVQQTYEIPLLNPIIIAQNPPNNNINFGKISIYKSTFIVTYSEFIVYFLNLKKLKIEATIKRLRKIQNLIVNNNEIFILEGPRSIVRISIEPEPFVAKTSRKIFSTSFNLIHQQQQQHRNLLYSHMEPQQLQQQHQHQQQQQQEHNPPIEFEAEEENVISAEECFELPPIERINLDIPLEISLNEHHLLKQDKLLLEHSRKVKIFEKINDLDYDNSILFKSGHYSNNNNNINNNNNNNNNNTTNKVKKKKTSGIVEIAQQAEFAIPTTVNVNASTSNVTETVAETSKPSTSTLTKHNDRLTSQTTTRPCLLEASFCDGVSIVPDLRSPNTINKDLIEKEKHLAEVLNIEPVKLENIPLTNKLSMSDEKTHIPIFEYPVKYLMPQHTGNNSTPLKKIHFINDDDDDDDDNYDNDDAAYANDGNSKNDNNVVGKKFHNLSDDMKNVMIKSDSKLFSKNTNNINNNNNKMIKSLQFQSGTTDVPEIKEIPNFMRVPNLWNFHVEETSSSNGNYKIMENNESHENKSSSSSSEDWELI